METQKQTAQGKYAQITAKVEELRRATKVLEKASIIQRKYDEMMRNSDTINRVCLNDERRRLDSVTPWGCYIPVPNKYGLSNQMVEQRSLTKEDFELGLKEQRAGDLEEVENRLQMYKDSIGRQDESIHMNELKRAMKDLGTCVGMIDEHYQYTPYSSEKVEPFKSYPVRETNLKGLQMHLREMGERGLK